MSLNDELRNRDRIREIKRHIGQSFAQKYSADEPRDDHGRWTTGGSYGEAHAADLKDEGQRQGGFTLDAVSGARPTSGWMISYEGRERSIAGSKLTPDFIRTYVKDNLDVLGTDNHYLGGWLDKSTDTFFLDASQNEPSLDKALALGVDRNQYAIYNVGTGEERIVDSARSQERDSQKSMTGIDKTETPSKTVVWLDPTDPEESYRRLMELRDENPGD